MSVARCERRTDVGDDLAGTVEPAALDQRCGFHSQTLVFGGESIEESMDVGGILGPLVIVA